MSWSKSDIENVLAELEADFRKTPRKFFTEHDIHSRLHGLVEAELEKQGKRLIRSNDDQTTSLVHLEYPTPFRCDMSKHDFKVVGDKERTKRGRLYRRGHYDLVVLNPDFVRSYDSVIVSGKNYRKFCSVIDDINVTPLLWVCEILFGAHVEDDLPKNWMKLVVQDSKKVIETLNYKVGKGLNFARCGSVLVFLGVTSEKTEKLEENIREFGLSQGFKVRVVVNRESGCKCSWCHDSIEVGEACVQSEARYAMKWHADCTPEWRYRRFGERNMNKPFTKEILREEHERR